MEIRTGIQINLDTEPLRKAAQDQLLKSAQHIASKAIEEYLNIPTPWSPKPGQGYLKINAMLQEMLESSDTEERLRRMIAARWDSALEQAMEKAILHQANKAAWQAAIRHHKETSDAS